jgi:hypothetical protein
VYLEHCWRFQKSSQKLGIGRRERKRRDLNIFNKWPIL